MSHRMRYGCFKTIGTGIVLTGLLGFGIFTYATTRVFPFIDNIISDIQQSTATPPPNSTIQPPANSPPSSLEKEVLDMLNERNPYLAEQAGELEYRTIIVKDEDERSSSRAKQEYMSEAALFLTQKEEQEGGETRAKALAKESLYVLARRGWNSMKKKDQREFQEIVRIYVEKIETAGSKARKKSQNPPPNFADALSRELKKKNLTWPTYALLDHVSRLKETYRELFPKGNTKITNGGEKQLYGAEAFATLFAAHSGSMYSMPTQLSLFYRDLLVAEDDAAGRADKHCVPPRTVPFSNNYLAGYSFAINLEQIPRKERVSGVYCRLAQDLNETSAISAQAGILVSAGIAGIDPGQLAGEIDRNGDNVITPAEMEKAK